MGCDNEQIKMIKIDSYVLKQGSPDISCVVMMTCNSKNNVNRDIHKAE